jgi:hypothetical protein
MTQDQKHTALPYKAYKNRLGMQTIAHNNWCNKGETADIANVLTSLNEETDKANAEFIVRACNSFYDWFFEIKRAQEKIRKATDHIKRLPDFTGGVSTPEDFADMHCIEALNILNNVMAKAMGLPPNSCVKMDKPKPTGGK